MVGSPQFSQIRRAPRLQRRLVPLRSFHGRQECRSHGKFVTSDLGNPCYSGEEALRGQAPCMDLGLSEARCCRAQRPSRNGDAPQPHSLPFGRTGKAMHRLLSTGQGCSHERALLRTHRYPGQQCHEGKRKQRCNYPDNRETHCLFPPDGNTLTQAAGFASG